MDVHVRDLPIPAAWRNLALRASAYVEQVGEAVVREEAPLPCVVVIFDVEHALSVGGDASVGPFVAGLSMHTTRTAHAGTQRGVELRLAPTTVRTLFGCAPGDLRDQIVPLADLAGAREVAERMRDASTVPAMMNLLVPWLGQLQRRLPDPRDAVVQHMVERVRACAGRVRITDLVRETGYSHKHVVALFRERVGVSPKELARLARLEHALGHILAHPQVPLSDVAFRSGFSDQAHLTREVRALTGRPPPRTEVHFLQATPTLGSDKAPEVPHAQHPHSHDSLPRCRRRAHVPRAGIRVRP